MTFSIPFDGSPFSAAQRAWLNDFLAGGPRQGRSIPGMGAAPMPHPKPKHDRQRPFRAPVLSVQTLTGAGSAKDVRLVAFDLRGSGLQYHAGDALGVYPENCPELAHAILDQLHATGEEVVTTPAGARVTALDALTKECCIAQANDRVLAVLARSAGDPAEARGLRELLESDPDDVLDGQDILDLLGHFPSARPAVGDLVSALVPLQPRLYSISSAPAAHPEEVHLTVGVVRYRQPGCDRLRKGVASTFLAERLRTGHTARIFVQPSHGFKLPQRGDTPIIMVGPGTGIAPFRAFLQERRALHASGPSWLFFGDQHRASDFLYRQEIEEYLRNGTLTYLDAAFSRDQPEKVYVQHRMLASAPRLWEWLERGAHVYVCGDARRMARDVDATLHRIVAEQGSLDPAAAKTYVAGLVRAKRYQRDVY